MAREYALESYAARLLLKAVGIVLLAALVLYPLDWAVWRVRVARGGGMGQVEVNEVVAAELKGGKEEYYGQGTAVVSCSRSVYPQGGYGACWWTERHREVLVRY